MWSKTLERVIDEASHVIIADLDDYSAGAMNFDLKAVR